MTESDLCQYISANGISIATNVMAAFGPTMGGLLVTYAGWHSIFWINIPVALLVLILAFSWIPADKKNPASRERKNVLHMVDLPGIVLFSGMITSLIFFLVSLGKGTQCWLLIVVPIAAALLIMRELRTDKPFLDVRMLASNVRLTSVFAQYAGLNIVFYFLFFGLPLWFGQVRGYEPQTAGLLMLPFSGIGVLTTPLLGSIFAISLIGLIFSGSVTTTGLHIIAIVTALISVGLLVVGRSRKNT
ncbi:MFS transporter [Brevibacillus brevis]|uniref:MFS transporter n=1 Tax=Brevibacillus brevis TaxID=1393 RepID=UPI001643A037|nr:MFS transporter [Brevibacillus brevis]